MTHRISSDGKVAVDYNYYWQPISTCPYSVKVQLLGRGGVAHYGTYFGVDDFYVAWAPLPKISKEINDLLSKTYQHAGAPRQTEQSCEP